MNLWQIFLHVTGADNVSGAWYGFWSGFGSDLTEFALLGSLFAWYRRHKCSVCWRLSYKPVKGTGYRTCHKHLTMKTHTKLRAKHKREYPEQHELLGEGL